MIMIMMMMIMMVQMMGQHQKWVNLLCLYKELHFQKISSKAPVQKWRDNKVFKNITEKFITKFRRISLFLNFIIQFGISNSAHNGGCTLCTVAKRGWITILNNFSHMVTL
jgi:hypothetical protein